ncbi:hypothetical protein EJE24_22650 [Enterobacter huaxiensis]|uniref:Uncharacterized protein n=1 Tax=Enterobacter huaxiensis TaxID=2494702 RepID=A0A3R9NQF4_9ENTR|nr:hypothetical protein [Enterobacter huaxiensis]RSK63149.1 hypothetical protein EJE24_22650 [Enterobacter huaxiensis]
MSRIVRPVIDILTNNWCLETGLRAVLDETTYMLTDEHVFQKIVLIDAGSLGAYKAAEAWPSLVKQIRRADRYTFLSLVDACHDDVPHLPVHGALSAVKAGMPLLINSLTVSPQVRCPPLFCRLSEKARKVMYCLAYEYSVEDIHWLLQYNKKHIYYARSRLMKKYNLGSHRALYDILQVFAFITGIKAFLFGRPVFHSTQRLASR